MEHTYTYIHTYILYCYLSKGAFQEHNEVLGITNDFLQPGQNYSKIYGAETRFNEPRFNVILDRYNEHNPQS